MSRACIAVDIGGTKIAALLVDAQGAILAETRCPTPAAEGAAAVLAAAQDCIARLPQRPADLAVAGISAAGVIDARSGIVLDATDALPGWKGQDLRTHFTRLLGVPVACANDVQCALHGELWLNPALRKLGGTIAMLTLGTGLGGAIAHQGEVLTGAHGIAGHIGRTRLVHGGQEVSLETLVSGTGLGMLYRERSGLAADGPVILQRVAQGEAEAVDALDAWTGQLALAIHNLYWLLDPAALVLGGGMIDAKAQWWPGLEQRLRARAVPLPLLPAALGNAAGALGAARLAWSLQG